MKTPTILVVDDHAGFRATARRMLERDGWTVVGEAANGSTALTEAATLHPDVVLLDIGLPDMDGFGVADKFASQPAGGPAIVLISSRDRSAYGSRLAASPVLGFIAKDDLDGPVLRDLLAQASR